MQEIKDKIQGLINELEALQNEREVNAEQVYISGTLFFLNFTIQNIEGKDIHTFASIIKLVGETLVKNNEIHQAKRN